MTHSNLPYPDSKYRAYLSEPITRCPQREKSRIQTLVGKLTKTLIQPPYETSLYVPSRFTSPEKRALMRPEHVYLLDRIRVVQADFLLVIADHTSFGIGGEVEIGTSLGKPIVFVSRAKKLSRFLIGSPANAARAAGPSAPYFLAYRDWWDLRPRLLPLIERILKKIECAEIDQLPSWNLPRRLRGFREESGLSCEELAKRAGLLSSLIELWETPVDELRRALAQYDQKPGFGLGPIALNPRQTEQLLGISMDALHRLAFALNVSVSQLVGEDQKHLPSKGPAKVSETIRNQMTETRLDNLRLRAEQFDITFREFRLLEKTLVHDFLDRAFSSNPTPARSLAIISEQEFSHELQSIRSKMR